MVCLHTSWFSQFQLCCTVPPLRLFVLQSALPAVVSGLVGLEPKGGFGGGGGELDGEARGSGGLPHCAGGVLGGDDLSLQCWRP